MMYNEKRTEAVREMAVIGLFSAFMSVISPFAIPIGPISITLATFAVYLSAAVLGTKRGAAAVAIYLMLGFVGLPVFSGFAGGAARLLGPTGGYLVGYIPCTVIIGFFADRFKKLWADVVGMIAGTVVLYALGTAWYCKMSGTAFCLALSMCVFPFLIGDGIKIGFAAVLASKLRKIIR